MIVPFLIAAAKALSSNVSISPASFRKAFNSSRPIALRKTVDEERLRAPTEDHDAPKSGRLAVSFPSHALLDHAAAQVSVD